MTRESMSLAFRYSVDLARAQDQLATMTARLATMTDLVAKAADDLSGCRVTIGGKTMRVMEAPVLRAANRLCEALLVSGFRLPTLVDAVIAIEGEPIDLTEMSRILTVDGGNIG